MHKKYMGKMDRVVFKYLEDTLQEFNTPYETVAFLTFPSLDDNLLEIARKFVKENTHFKKVYETIASSTITSHCGHNTVGIIYYTDGKEKK